MNGRRDRYGGLRATIPDPEARGSFLDLHIAPTGQAAVNRWCLDNLAWIEQRRAWNECFGLMAQTLTQPSHEERRAA